MNIKTIAFNKNNYPDVITAVNKIAKATDRKPHDAIKRLILDEAKRLTETNPTTKVAG